MGMRNQDLAGGEFSGGSKQEHTAANQQNDGNGECRPRNASEGVAHGKTTVAAGARSAPAAADTIISPLRLAWVRQPPVEWTHMGSASQLVQIELGPPVRQPKPSWLRAKAPG